MKKGRLISLTLSVLVTLTVLVAYLQGKFDVLEHKAVDARYGWRGLVEPHNDLVIVSVDEKSIAEMGQFPWPRGVHAKLISTLTKAGAKAIAFDILFLENDKDHPEGDVLLGEAAEKSGKVVFGMVFDQSADNTAIDPKVPIDELAQEHVLIGSVNIFPEVDGVNRALPAWVDFAGQKVPGLSLAALAISRGVTPEKLLEELNLPTVGSWNELYLNFLGAKVSPEGKLESPFPHIPFVDVITGRTPAAFFQDKIVLVGGTAIALFDYTPVPNIPNFPGLDVHATALHNFLSGNFLRKAGSHWTLLLILGFGLFGGFLFARVAAWQGAGAGVVLLAGLYAVCQYLFVRKFVVLEFIAPATAVLGTYVAVLFYRFMTEEKEKRWIKGAFSQYLSPQVVEVLQNDPSKLRLGGEEREMTVFFSDLAGFTSISEALKPTELVTILNEYLTDMSDIILKHGGLVDKYIGDAIMAFWNAPVDQPRHAEQACLAAIEQIQKLGDLQRRFSERGLPLIDCRVGVNTGPMVVGNMGTKAKLNYTVMGDAVNLASRLEGANKPFHTHIMISEFTYEKAKDAVEARELDLLRVKGKAIPIKVYDLVARKGDLTPAQKDAFFHYEEGLKYYRDQKFERAIESFRKVQSYLPEDGPSDVYIKRAQDFIATPPPAGWDGVYVMTTK